MGANLNVDKKIQSTYSTVDQILSFTLLLKISFLKIYTPFPDKWHVSQKHFTMQNWEGTSKSTGTALECDFLLTALLLVMDINNIYMVLKELEKRNQWNFLKIHFPGMISVFCILLLC